MKTKRNVLSTLGLVLSLLALLLPVPGLAAGAGPEGAAAVTASTYYDSGWHNVAPGLPCLTLTHGLGGNPLDYAVELEFLDTNDGLGINRFGYGGLDLPGPPPPPPGRYGGHWEKLTASTIDLCRGDDDMAADRMRVRVWLPPTTPDYASPWTPINPGQTISFPHNLGVNRDDLSVGLWFRGTARGIHHRGFGGLAISALQELHGAHWHHLTENGVQVTRHPADTNVEEVRVVVVQGDPPHYDSGWQNVVQAPIPNLFTHNLNWNPNQLLVRGECWSPTAGIHQWLAGGSVHWTEGAQGTHIQNLTNNSVQLFRWPNDTVCPKARIRIWRRAIRLYLPLVQRNA